MTVLPDEGADVGVRDRVVVAPALGIVGAPPVGVGGVVREIYLSQFSIVQNSTQLNSTIAIGYIGSERFLTSYRR